MTNKRITLSAGDYIKLSDIPNEQVFKLVKQCFINAGFNDCNGKYAQWCNRDNYTCITIGANDDLNEFSQAEERQLSLSDVFNSVNGGFDWQGCSYVHFFKDGYISYSNDKVLYPIIDTHPIKRIPEEIQAIIPPKTTQWWDYEKGVAVGLPERSSLVLQNGKEYEVLRSTVNDTNDSIVLLCLNVDRPDTSSNIFWVNVRDIKPLDWDKLSKRKEVVNKALDIFANADGLTDRDGMFALYDAGLLKGGE